MFLLSSWFTRTYPERFDATSSWRLEHSLSITTNGFSKMQNLILPRPLLLWGDAVITCKGAPGLNTAQASADKKSKAYLVVHILFLSACTE